VWYFQGYPPSLRVGDDQHGVSFALPPPFDRAEYRMSSVDRPWSNRCTDGRGARRLAMLNRSFRAGVFDNARHNWRLAIHTFRLEGTAWPGDISCSATVVAIELASRRDHGQDQPSANRQRSTMRCMRRPWDDFVREIRYSAPLRPL